MATPRKFRKTDAQFNDMIVIAKLLYSSTTTHNLIRALAVLAKPDADRSRLEHLAVQRARYLRSRYGLAF